MMTRLMKFSLFLLVWVVQVPCTEAWTPGYQMRTGCAMLVTGGSDYNGGGLPNTRKEIVLHSAQTASKKTVRELEKNFIDIHLSQTCKWISVCEVGEGSEKYTTRIFTSEGLDVCRLPKAGYSEWGIDSRGIEYIAYIVGEYVETEGLASQGTWLLNMETREQKQIHDRGQAVAWAEFDQCFYIADVPHEKVRRYNLQTKRSEETTSYGIDFSPKGTYYVLVTT